MLAFFGFYLTIGFICLIAVLSMSFHDSKDKDKIIQGLKKIKKDISKSPLTIKLGLIFFIICLVVFISLVLPIFIIFNLISSIL